jgi:hypothetical protein
MYIILAAMLAGPTVLPQIDRRSLELQARAEALQPATSRAARRTAPRRASSGGPLDLASITTICRAAGDQSDPAAFIARISGAYSLNSADSASLRSSCAAYLAGRADARRTGSTY